MKNWLKSTLAVVFAFTFLLMASISFAQVPSRYFAEVRDEIGRSIQDATVQVFVYDAGTKTLSTIYSDVNLTAKTNPITTTQFNTDDMVNFFSTATSHDVLVSTTTGEVHLFSGMTKNDHSIIVNKNGVGLKHLIIPFSGVVTTEIDTGWDLPRFASVEDVVLEVVTAAGSQTVDVGLLSTETAGDANGFLAATASSSAGYITSRPVITGGTNIDFTGATTYGVLLASAITGSDAVATNGGFQRKHHFVTGSNATSISYTRSNSTTSAGYIHVFYTLMR